MNRPMNMSNGLSRVRHQFLKNLTERRNMILQHTLAAVETSDPTKAGADLAAVKDILHKIAGTGGSLGFGQLGTEARRLEYEIIDLKDQTVPDALLEGLLAFADQCQDAIEGGRKEPRSNEKISLLGRIRGLK